MRIEFIKEGLDKNFDFVAQSQLTGDAETSAQQHNQNRTKFQKAFNTNNKSSEGEQLKSIEDGIERWDKNDLTKNFRSILISRIAQKGWDKNDLFIKWLMNTDDNNIKALDAQSATTLIKHLDEKHFKFNNNYIIDSSNELFSESSRDIIYKLNALYMIMNPKEANKYKNETGDTPTINLILQDGKFLPAKEMQKALENFSEDEDEGTEGISLKEILRKLKIDYENNPDQFLTYVKKLFKDSEAVKKAQELASKYNLKNLKFSYNSKIDQSLINIIANQLNSFIYNIQVSEPYENGDVLFSIVKGMGEAQNSKSQNIIQAIKIFKPKVKGAQSYLNYIINLIKEVPEIIREKKKFISFYTDLFQSGQLLNSLKEISINSPTPKKIALALNNYMLNGPSINMRGRDILQNILNKDKEANLSDLKRYIDILFDKSPQFQKRFESLGPVAIKAQIDKKQDDFESQLMNSIFRGEFLNSLKNQFHSQLVKLIDLK